MRRRTQYGTKKVLEKFVKIHPFPGRNGRTYRLMINYQLMNNEYLLVSIKVEQKLEYYKVLDLYATTGDLQPFKN